MIKPAAKKWNKLQYYFKNPPIALLALKKHWFQLLRIKPSIKYLIEKQQRETYGKPVFLSKHTITKHKYTANDERRIEYYLGNIGKQPVSMDRATKEVCPDPNPSKLILANYKHIRQAEISGRIKSGYTLPLLNLFNLLPDVYKRKDFLYRYGDNSQKYPWDGILAKTRLCDDATITLLKLTPLRHWRNLQHMRSCDIDYRQKKDMAIWRGASTGTTKTKGNRTDLVNRFYEHTHSFDVGYSKLITGNEPWAHLIKGKKTLEEQFQYKFLICLEGNDVATGLKWMLQSNSVVMMPKPTISSWLMEDTLQPFVHYIPLADDFSDAEERFDWAVNHEAECVEISKNASRYMSPFLDPRREILIECEVFRRYLDNIDFY